MSAAHTAVGSIALRDNSVWGDGMGKCRTLDRWQGVEVKDP